MKFSRGKKSGGNELFTVPVKMKQEGEFVRLLFRFIEFFFFFTNTFAIVHGYVENETSFRDDKSGSLSVFKLWYLRLAT